MKTGFNFKPGAEEGGGGTPLSRAMPGFRGTIRHQEGVQVPLRLREMGFVAGTDVAVLRQGPLGDPIEIELRGYRICLRRSDLELLRADAHAIEPR